MKKIWQNHCYTIILVGAVFVFSLFFSYTSNNKDNTLDGYLSVTVNTGDTLWKMADTYNTNNLTRDEFIDWILENNEIYAHSLKPGDTIVIPVTKVTGINTLASE